MKIGPQTFKIGKLTQIYVLLKGFKVQKPPPAHFTLDPLNYTLHPVCYTVVQGIKTCRVYALFEKVNESWSVKKILG